MYLNEEIHLKIDGMDRLNAVAEKAQRQLNELIDTMQELNHVRLLVEVEFNNEVSSEKNS